MYLFTFPNIILWPRMVTPQIVQDFRRQSFDLWSSRLIHSKSDSDFQTLGPLYYHINVRLLIDRVLGPSRLQNHVRTFVFLLLQGRISVSPSSLDCWIWSEGLDTNRSFCVSTHHSIRLCYTRVLSHRCFSRRVLQTCDGLPKEWDRTEDRDQGEGEGIEKGCILYFFREFSSFKIIDLLLPVYSWIRFSFKRSRKNGVSSGFTSPSS